MASLVNPQFTGNNSNRANTAFTFGVLSILAAYGFQYIGGYEPCELCYGQRIPYYVGLPILAGIIISWKVMYIPLRIALTGLVAAIFIWSIYLGGFHAGVEWGFWPGPTSCTGLQDMSFGDLGSLNDVHVVPCDQPEIRILGLSFAGMNAVISTVITGFLVWSMLGQIRRYKLVRAREKARAARAGK